MNKGQEKLPKTVVKIEKQPSFEEVIVGLKKQLENDCCKVGNFIALKVALSPELTGQIAEFLVKYIIEDYGQKQQASGRKGILTNTFMALAETPVATHFCQGVLRALIRYFDCREELRGGEEEYFQIWLNFVSLSFEFGQISQEGFQGDGFLIKLLFSEPIIQLIFDIFEYLLSEPVLNSLKIAEVNIGEGDFKVPFLKGFSFLYHL